MAKARPRRIREEDQLPLTEREVQTLALIALGYKNRQIAEVMHVSEETVKTRLRILGGKLGKGSRAAMVYAAIKQGWLEVDYEPDTRSTIMLVPEEVERALTRTPPAKP